MEKEKNWNLLVIKIKKYMHIDFAINVIQVAKYRKYMQLHYHVFVGTSRNMYDVNLRGG